MQRTLKGCGYGNILQPQPFVISAFVVSAFQAELLIITIRATTLKLQHEIHPLNYLTLNLTSKSSHYCSSPPAPLLKKERGENCEKFLNLFNIYTPSFAKRGKGWQKTHFTLNLTSRSSHDFISPPKFF